LAPKDDDYKLREQQLMERIRKVDPSWLEEDSVPQSIQFMIDLLPTIRTLLRDWPTWKTLSVLDVGAASGAGSNLLATMHREHFFGVKMKVDALDIEPRFKTYADSHFSNIRYLIGDIYRLDNTNVWDLIICSHTLEHVPDYRKFLSELQRRAKHWVLVYVPYEEKNLIPIHHNSFTERTVRSLKPTMFQVLESPAWKAPVEKKDEVRKCILFVMNGLASQEPINHSSKAEEEFKVIQRLVNDKDYGKAIIATEELLKKWPTDGRLNYFLAFSLQSLDRDAQKSLAHYDFALKHGYDEFWVKYHRGLLHMKMGELQQASLDLVRALELKPWDEDTKLVLKEIEHKGFENVIEEKSQNTTLGHQKIIEEKDNQIRQLNESKKDLETELKRVINEVDTLRNTNLGHQRTIESNQKSIEVLQNVTLGHQKIIEEKDNQIRQLNESDKAAEEELQQAFDEVDTLQRINLGHQRTIESYQKSVEVLQNVTLEHRKTVEEKDNQIRQLNKLNKAAEDQLEQTTDEVDALQNVNLEYRKTIEEKDSQIRQLTESSMAAEDQHLQDMEQVDALQNINLEYRKTIEEKDSQIRQLTESSRAMDMELRNLRSSIAAIQNSITWRTLTPLKIRYDAIFHRINNKPNTASLQTTEGAAAPLQTSSGEQVIKPIVPHRLEDKKDIVCFPITDWSFRYQRSNHLLSRFANNGHRIFYLTVNLYHENTPYSISNITDNIFEVKLNCVRHFNIYDNIIDKEITESLLLSLQKTQEDFEISAFSYVAFPSWARLVLALKEKHGWPIIYDCMDDYYGFGNVNKARIDEEQKLFRGSDLVLTASSFLYKKARKVTDKTLYMPNACEFDHFKRLPENDLLKDVEKPIAGYYGAIADWFDNELIEYVAAKKPNVNFIFIGRTFGSNIVTLKKLPNVHFLGEKPYPELPLYLYHFDVCLIPFKATRLIEATHPVKFYEYLASGKPVISTRLTELIPFGNLCYLSSDKEEFLANLDRALDENDYQMVSRRIEFASKNTWDHRFGFLYPEVKNVLSCE
jgi:glycosyltransferase involved in cell wall biosynthesis/SAM-dependent methyltransferase